MENSILAFVLLTMFGLLLIAAAISDIRSRNISNRLNAAIALLAIPFWIVSGLSLWPDVAIQLGVALAVFLLFLGLYAIGGMGGGDVKMLGAAMLWIPLPLSLPMLTVMALGGGLLSAAMLIHSRLRPADKPPEVPYGVPIAAAGLWVLHQQYLNQFQAIGLT